jgi:transmembrane protein DUF3566
MTQSPQSGQGAPLTTEFDPDTARHTTSGAPGLGYDANGAGSNGTPSPSTPTTSTPWGSTSTVPGSTAPNSPGGHGSGGAPPWAAPAQVHPDAPTAAVPLVQGTAAPSMDPHMGPAASYPPNRTPRAARARGPRRARLQLRHINPWTVLKFSCVLSIALFFVWLIVIGVLFGVLDGAGVIGKINDAYTTIQGGSSKPPVTAGVVFGGAAIIGVVNIVLFIALSTVGSVVYNLCADLVGGIEITLSER